jgi:hypothetical protein
MILKSMRTGVQFSSFVMIGLLLPCITARVLVEEATDPLRFRNITQPSETLEKSLSVTVCVSNTKQKYFAFGFRK